MIVIIKKCGNILIPGVKTRRFTEISQRNDDLKSELLQTWEKRRRPAYLKLQNSSNFNLQFKKMPTDAFRHRWTPQR